MKEKHKYHVWDYVNIVVFYSIFICFFVASILGIVSCAKGELEVAPMIYRIVLTIAMCLPFVIKLIFKITFSKVVSIVFYVFMFLAGFMGVVLNYYRIFAWWDILIHFIMGLCISVLSIYILNLTIYKKDTSKHNIVFTFIFVICFTIAIGAVWEIIEFIGDSIFKMGFQRYVTYSGTYLVGRNALVDTMVDLIMDFAGAISGVAFIIITMTVDKNFLKTFKIKKLKHKEKEIEDIEE